MNATYLVVHLIPSLHLGTGSFAQIKPRELLFPFGCLLQRRIEQLHLLNIGWGEPCKVVVLYIGSGKNKIRLQK
jgi:hypothetical protein